MKILVNLTAAFMLAVFSLPAFSATTSPVKSFVAGALDVREIDKSMRVYAEYEGEEEITEALRQRIGELGFPLASSADDAKLIFRVIPLYLGKASDRPKAGAYDGARNTQGIALGRLLLGIALGAALDIKLVEGMPMSRAEPVISYWTGTLRDTGVISEVEHTFKPTRKAQEAIVSRVDLTVNGVAQSAQVVSESFAKDVPQAMLVSENLRQILWYLE
jgi:hypothetical protein